jgi:MoxR-like ATPase
MPLPEFEKLFSALVENIEKVIKGKKDVIRLGLYCVLAEGHLLIEDVPGVGKTSLARCVAASLGGTCHRVQFTPDLLPSDITGITVYDRITRQAVFQPGPVFANVVIADEINRASPKTQSALLEVMEERQVTAGLRTEAVPSPFFVVATQNPVDMEGTYSLPEAQLDRFLMRIRVGYPDLETEREIVTARDTATSLAELSAVVTGEQISAMIGAARLVRCEANVIDYAIGIVAATRTHPGLRLGASPRGSIALLRAARVRAGAEGRAVLPDDIQLLAYPVLAHRLLLTPDAELDGRAADQLLAEAIESVRVPDDLPDAGLSRV